MEQVVTALERVVSEVPPSNEGTATSPAERSRTLILKASAKAAVVSGSLALPPGPLGLLTVLPDLMAIWHIQRQLVSDIASAHGKSAQLGRREMIYCLFRHAASQAVRDVVVRVGQRYVVRDATLRAIERVLQRVGISVTQRAAGRALSRWLPVVGAVGIGGYAFYDTAQVGKTALAFFQKEIVREESAGGAAGRG
ncbi:MAG: hypothetical protein KBA95_10950 [Acidobacteria bacterium]|nr:hypothetical protein [Acidobacteriota bacterium]